MYLFMASLVLLAVTWHAVRHSRAKDAARQWLGRNRYRIVSIRTPWFPTVGFASSWLRDSDNSFVFEAIVDDGELGGTGKVFLRVWLTWLGEIDHEIEVVWDTVPDAERIGAPQPLWERLANAQLSALRRIADGEATFYAPRRDEERERFDDLVEHVQALAQRGMITCGEPRSDGRNGGRYTSIGDLRITDEGRGWLESQTKG